MGGSGSGRTGARPVAEHALRLPIGILRSQLHTVYADGRGSLRHGQLHWSSGHTRVASCAYTLDHTPAGLLATLQYSRQGTPVSTPIAITTSAPQLGGVRFWWTCPGCRRRCGILYAPRGFWRCRHCERITYASSNASDSGFWERMERYVARFH